MRKSQKPLFLLTLLVLVLLSCNLGKQPDLFPTSTPILVFPTMTSTFASQPPATSTLLPAVTATLSPTDLQPTAPPTQTPTSPPPTALPTNTQVPTTPPTAVPPTATQVFRYSSAATYLSSAPEINGPWDEWTTKQYPLQYVVFRAANWSGEEDLQASYRVGWDSTYLYLAVKVFDDEYVQRESGANMYLGDSLELLLSTNPRLDSPALGLASHDFQIGISPGKGGLGDNPEAYLWFPAAKESKLTNVPIGVVPMNGGYRLEFAVPWSVFGVTPARDQVYGFAISVSDNDDPDESVQQTMISSVYTRKLVDPSSWGILTLK